MPVKGSREKAEGSMRINQFLARAGMASRRGSEGLVLNGRVKINGQTVQELSATVNPSKDSVSVDGRRVSISERLSYYALYKPKEVVCTMSDPEGRVCIKAFLPKGHQGLFPVGRLDYHSEGLLLLTSDGILAERLLHPRHKVPKTYNVKVKGNPPHEALERLRKGITLDGRKTLPITILRIPSRETKHTWLKVEMMEGRKNQIREMFFRVQHPVIKLKRVAIGTLRIGGMKPGDVRPLTGEEVSRLKAEAGVESPPARGKKALSQSTEPI